MGIRGPIYGRADLDDDRRFGFRTIRASDIDDLGVPGTIDAITSRVADLPVYLSIDIDVLDPSFAPGTGTPEAGGLTSRELLRVLRGLTDVNLVSADLVEVSPAYDHAEITAIAAATVIFDIIALLARRVLTRSGNLVARRRLGSQSWAASVRTRASSAGRVNITSWLPAMGTILHGPSRDDMPGCHVPSGSARSSATAT